MTIGIAAVGPHAGLAIFNALAAVEKVGQGSVGGFLVFAAISGDGTLHRAETQRGGTSTLFVSGEQSGGSPPPAIARAEIAALMSSGPDRPTPLSQFLPAEPSVGMVTGHRLPNAAGITGRPVNLDILEMLRQGFSARDAVDAVLDADPECDAGIIAVDQAGQLYGRNSARVGRRPDIGYARLENNEHGAAIEVLHNAIVPVTPLAVLAAEVAMATMVPHVDVGEISIRAGTPLSAGDRHRVVVDGQGRVLEVETTDWRILTGRHNCAAIYLGAEVVQAGRLLGYISFEPNVLVDDGRIQTMSGQRELLISYRAE